LKRVKLLEKSLYVPHVYALCFTGLAGGADAAYIFEEKFGVQDLIKVTK
jgi:hypothetical protein